jgi:hypothetical protein
MDNKLYKALIVTLVDSSVVVFRGDAVLKRLFTEAGLPYPNSPKPVLSREFREYIFRVGFSISMEDTEEVGSVRFIPPSRIKNVDFYIGKKPVPEGEEFTKFMESLDFKALSG